MVPHGVILAGGLARRMGGGDKSLRALGGTPLLDHVRRRLQPQVAGLALNANGDGTRFATDLPVLADPVADFPGPLAGILAGMLWAKTQGASHVVSVAADTPFFPPDLVARLIAAAQAAQAPIALAATPDPIRGAARHPTFGLWSVSLADALCAALEDGTRKVVAFTDAHRAATALFPKEDAFFNVNTPQDLIRAEEML